MQENSHRGECLVLGLTVYSLRKCNFFFSLLYCSNTAPGGIVLKQEGVGLVLLTYLPSQEYCIVDQPLLLFELSGTTIHFAAK